jgi:thioredoxin reductase (NADPH)
MVNPKEVAVIGLGPSGVSAAIYLKRYGMIPFCFEKEIVGGKINKTQRIENYAGVKPVSGPDLGMLLEDQLSGFGISPIYEEVSSLTKNEDGTYTLTYGEQSHTFAYVILANGLGEKPFPIEGASLFHNRGISRCAICDGAFYQGKPVAVIGAGNAAFEEGTYLAGICSHVTLIARRTAFRADELAVERFKALGNTTVLAPYDVVKACGKDTLESVTVRNKDDASEKTIPVSALFLYVGEVPTTGFIRIPDLAMTNGYIVTDSRLETNQKHLYAAGDARNTPLRQVATATSDGALAATSVHDDYENTL